MNTLIRDNKGFTLVELAVVMVIIGLLIGGILKGQEMIENARVNSVVSQIKAIDAASATFQDMYDALAGDMIDADSRLPGMTTTENGNGNNVLGVAPLTDPAASDEIDQFFMHIDAADLLSGSRVVGGIEADIRGAAITIGQHTATGALGLNANARAGRYVVVGSQASGPDTDILTQLQAGRIDRKLDDGIPTAGSVIGAEGTSGACGTSAGYEEADDTISCRVLVRSN